MPEAAIVLADILPRIAAIQGDVIDIDTIRRQYATQPLLR